MSFPQKVKYALWAIVDSMTCNIAPFVKNPEKDFKRNRKLGFVQLVHFFLCMESGCISHELLKYFYFLPDEVPTASAFIQPSRKWQVKKGLQLTPYHFLYDLLSKRYLDVVVQPGRLKNKFAAFCQLIDRYLYDGCPSS